MQQHDLANKAKLFMDGEEMPGLVNLEECISEYGEIEVGESGVKRNISNGVQTIPKPVATFKIQRNSRIMKLLEDWFFNKETHDIVLVLYDADGAEFDRFLMPGSENTLFTLTPQYDATNPTYAQKKTRFLPYEFRKVAAA